VSTTSPAAAVAPPPLVEQPPRLVAAIERVERAEGSSSRLFLRGRADPVPVSRACAAQVKAALAARPTGARP